MRHRDASWCDNSMQQFIALLSLQLDFNLRKTEHSLTSKQNAIVADERDLIFCILVFLLLVQVAIQMRKTAWLTLHVTLCCHGNTIFSHTPSPHFSVLCHSVAADLTCPIISLIFTRTPIALALTILPRWSILGDPSSAWSIL